MKPGASIKKMGIYFIEDPDGYRLEIVPDRR